MVFSADFELDAQDAANWRSLGESAPRTMQNFLGVRMVNYMEGEVERRVSVTPGPVKLPIQWTSEKQRRYYFGFVAQRDELGNIIPYKRTGGFKWAWFVRFNLENFSIGIGNSAMTKGSPNWEPQPLFDFLMGEQQQQFHKNTGWIEGIDPILDIIIESMDIIADSWAELMESGSLV